MALSPGFYFCLFEQKTFKKGNIRQGVLLDSTKNKDLNDMHSKKAADIGQLHNS